MFSRLKIKILTKPFLVYKANFCIEKLLSCDLKHKQVFVLFEINNHFFCSNKRLDFFSKIYGKETKLVTFKWYLKTVATALIKLEIYYLLARSFF